MIPNHRFTLPGFRYIKEKRFRLNNFDQLLTDIRHHKVRFTMLPHQSLVGLICLTLYIESYQCGPGVTNATEKTISNHSSDFIAELLSGYDKIVPPPDEKPLVTRIGYFIIGFTDISEKNMDFTLSYFMRMYWNDSRLRFSQVEHGNLSYVTLNPEQMNEIWRPDPFYRDERGTSISETFSIADSFSRIYSSGEVRLSRKLETTFRCHMRLYDYPFDTQICSVHVGSYALTVDILDMKFIDSENPVEFHRDVDLVSFDLLGYSVKRYNETFSTGTYSTVTIDFTFRRNIGFYILQVNHPSLHFQLNYSSRFQFIFKISLMC